MTPPVNHSNSKPPVLPDDSQTPASSGAQAPANAGTPRPRPVAELPSSANAQATEAAKDDSKKTNKPKEESSFGKPGNKRQMGFEVGFGIDGGVNGHRDSTLFPKPYGRVGDLLNFNLRTALLWNVNPHATRFEIGPELNVDVTTGGKGGSNDITYGKVAAGVKFGVDFRRQYHSNVGSGPARLHLSVLPLGVGGGLDTAGGVRVHRNYGYAAKLAIGLNIFTVNVGRLELGGAAQCSTSFIDGNFFNTNDLMCGGSLTFRPSTNPMVTEKETTIEKEVCETYPDQITKTVEEINGAEGVQGLVAQIAEARAKVVKLRASIEGRKVDPLNREAIRDILRQQYIEKELDGLSVQPSSAEDWKNLEARLKEEARREVPDDYDHWAPLGPSEDVQTFVLPGALPKSCKKLGDLLKTVDKVEDDLRAIYNDLNRILNTPLPPRIREIVRETIERVQPNLSEIFFNNDRPKTEDLKALRKAMDAARGSDGKVNFNDSKVRKALETIFRDKKSKTNYVEKMLHDLQETADALNSDAMQAIKLIEVQGHTSLAGKEQHNLDLSQRRADAIREILIGMGVEASRLTAKGYGETNPVNPDEEGFPKGSPERADAAASNRRIQLNVTDGEIERVINSSSSLAPFEYSSSATTVESAAGIVEGPQPKPAVDNDNSSSSIRPRPSPEVDGAEKPKKTKKKNISATVADE